jgi:hypothetical protein
MLPLGNQYPISIWDMRGGVPHWISNFGKVKDWWRRRELNPRPKRKSTKRTTCLSVSIGFAMTA